LTQQSRKADIRRETTHLPFSSLMLETLATDSRQYRRKADDLPDRRSHWYRLVKFGEDIADCVWLAKNFERGAIASYFVPPEQIRRLRTLTRYRRHLTEERTREKQRCEKLLEDALLTELRGVLAGHRTCQ
jgi:Transposase